MKIRLLLPILALVLLAFTLPSKKKKEQTNKPLIETHWGLKQIFGEEIPVLEKAPFIVFDVEGNYHGYLGCNNFFGKYFCKQKSISFYYDGATKKLCFNNMEVEKQFLTALKSEIKTYVITNDTLVLFNSKSKEVLRFEAGTASVLEPESAQ